MYNYCRKHSKDVTDVRQKKRFRYVVKGEVANNKQLIYRYFTGFVPLLNREKRDFSVTFIIQGLHAVQNQSNNNLLCRYYSAIKNYCWESVLDEQQFQELSPLHFLRTFLALNLNCNSRTFKELPSILLREQRFLSCMTSSVYEVVRMAFLSRKQTNYATDKPCEWLH